MPPGLIAKMSLPECSHHSVTGWEIGRDLWWTVQVRHDILNVLTGHTVCMYFTNIDPDKIITDVKYLRRKSPSWKKEVNLIFVSSVFFCDDTVEILELAIPLFLGTCIKCSLFYKENVKIYISNSVFFCIELYDNLY